MNVETPDQIRNREWARYHFGACDDGSIRPDDAIWNLESVPVALLAHLYEEGAKVFLDAEIASWVEEYDVEPHWCAFLRADDFDQYLREHCDFPIIISIGENDRLQVWDGWHRIACAVARGEVAVEILVGRPIEHGHKFGC